MGTFQKYNWPFKKKRDIDIKIIKPTDRSLWNKCESLEYEIFHECGYVPISAEDRLNDFDCYPTMEFLAAFQKSSGKSYETKKLLGILRTIYSCRGNKLIKESFPTLYHANKLDYTSNEALHDSKLKPPYEDNKTLWLYADIFDWLMKCDPRKFVDWAAIAVTQEGRDLKAADGMIGGAVKRAWEQPPIKYCLIAADWELIKSKKKRIPQIMSQIVDLGPPVMYWGSKTMPFLVDLYQLPKGILKLLIVVYRIKGYMQSRM